MKRIAIVGVGPTGIYTFYELVKRGEPLAITLFEKEAQAGVGMPYSDDNTAAQMLANIASIEIPPIDLTYLQWLQQQSDDWLAARGLERHALHERQFLPRVILGEYYRDRFLYLVERARDVGFVISVCESCEVTDIAVQSTGIAIHTDSAADPVIVDLVAIATGHLWPEEERASRQYFPSPWTGLMEARIAPCRVGILGTSLSASDAAVAADMVRAEVEGFRDKKMLCCAKHFPGIGAAAGDSHEGAITIDSTSEELETVDLVPFRAAIEAGVPVIMVGHVSLPNIIGDSTPAPLSSAVVQGMLRDSLGYTGVVGTDSLSMGAITSYYTPAEAAVAALKAGCDIPLMPERFDEASQGVLDAVQAGELTEERLDESLIRILSAKQEYFGL